jgi:hypothetical protein
MELRGPPVRGTLRSSALNHMGTTSGPDRGSSHPEHSPVANTGSLVPHVLGSLTSRVSSVSVHADGVIDITGASP